jgi:acetoin utilization deacetylase AcuC-like enzyme
MASAIIPCARLPRTWTSACPTALKTGPIVTARSAPDLVFYNAGVDPHFADRLGRMKLTDVGLRERDRTVIGHFRERGIPLCGVIGGGYSADVAALAERHAILFEVAAELSGGS